MLQHTHFPLQQILLVIITFIAASSSYLIYTRRNKGWENPEILKFYW